MTTVPQSIQEQIQMLAPSAVIELFQLHFDKTVNNADPDTMVNNGAIKIDDNTSVFYYHAGTNEVKGNIVFDSITYTAIPCEIEGFKRSTQGTLPRPTFSIANANSAISSLLQITNSEGKKLNPLKAKVVRVRTCKKFLDAANFTSGSNATADPTAIFEANDTWYIDRIASENLNVVSFELATKLDLTNVNLPRRSIQEFCPFKYRGEACGYNGTRYFDVNDNAVETEADDVCGHRYSSCKKRFLKEKILSGGYVWLHYDDDDPLPFGGFTGARLQI